MSQFDLYAAYYDLLYKDKDYQAETNYINTNIKKYAPDTKNIIELGCGTGIHAQLLTKKGYKVTGIDIAESMIAKAKSRNPELEFICDDLQTFSLDQKADTILALFHVISYQTSNQALKIAIKNVKQHLKSDGLFMFDVWHGPAVMSIKPDVKIKRFEEGTLKVTRIAEPEQNFEENTVDVNYQVFVKNDGNYSEFNETHKMRYFFRVELEFLLEQYDMELVHSEEWLTEKEPSKDSWGVLYIVKNKIK